MAKELLFSITRKDLDIDWFSGTGAGGQYRNKHQNCCRIRHRESGAMATGQSQRHRHENVKEALNGLVNNPKFKLWHARKVMEAIEGKTLDQKVDAMMSISNLKIEVKENGRWVEPACEIE